MRSEGRQTRRRWGHAVHPQCKAAQTHNSLKSLNLSAESLGAADRDNKYGYRLLCAKAAVDRIPAEGCDARRVPPCTQLGGWVRLTAPVLRFERRLRSLRRLFGSVRGVVRSHCRTLRTSARAGSRAQPTVWRQLQGRPAYREPETRGSGDRIHGRLLAPPTALCASSSTPMASCTGRPRTRANRYVLKPSRCPPLAAIRSWTGPATACCGPVLAGKPHVVFTRFATGQHWS
jgi:hypothetical protein